VWKTSERKIKRERGKEKERQQKEVTRVFLSSDVKEEKR
jgi:hypothetical protein